MPIFTYICANGHTHDALAANGCNPIPCPECRLSSSRLFKTPQVITMQPYMTKAGDGVLTEIRSSKAESAYEKQHGIAHLTDGDMKQMREGLEGQRGRIRKKKFAEREPFAESYARAEASIACMGEEHVKEQVQKEARETVEAVDN